MNKRDYQQCVSLVYLWFDLPNHILTPGVNRACECRMLYSLSLQFESFLVRRREICVWRAVTWNLKIQAEFTAAVEAAVCFSLWARGFADKACDEAEKRWEMGKPVGRERLRNLFDRAVAIFMLLFQSFSITSVVLLTALCQFRAYRMLWERMKHNKMNE